MQQQNNQVKPPSQVSQQVIQKAFRFSQYINTIKLISSQKDYKDLSLLQQLNQKPDWIKCLNVTDFRHLAVQFFYLLYSCFHLKIVPIPEDYNRRFVVSEESGMVMLCLSDFCLFENSVITTYQTRVPYFMYFKNFIEDLYRYWRKFEQGPQVLLKRRQMTGSYLLEKIQERLKKDDLETQEMKFKSLEKEPLFYEYSVLLRISRSSLGNLVRSSPFLTELYKKHRIIQNDLLDQYNDLRLRQNKTQKLAQIDNIIQKNLDDFFKALTHNPKYLKPDQSFYKQIPNTPIAAKKLLFELKIFDIQQNGSLQFNFHNTYKVQYNSLKNMILVRMITDLVLDLATSDAIFFKWSTLTFETSNVGLESIELLDQNKKTKKFFVVRASVSYNRKEAVIEKIITLIDITMATYKSIEVEMKSENFLNKSLAKIEESYLKIKHNLNLINHICQKTYTSIMKQIK